MEKKMYQRIGHVANAEPEIFYKGLEALVKEFQDAGCEVEVQYQTMATATSYAFTALVLGHEKVNT